jgi:5-methylcytosine-specific restriction endonuclease McrA
MEHSKTCVTCRQTKPFAEFNKNKRMAYGLSNKCRPCDNAQSAKFRAEHPEKAKASVTRWKAKNSERIVQLNRAYAKRNPGKYSEYAKVRRARLMSVGVAIVSEKEITRLYASPCFYCGSIERIEIDHAIPLSRGGRHAIGNLVPACRICNSTKHSKTIMEFRLWLSKQKETGIKK